jgi:hypothetical protein
MRFARAMRRKRSPILIENQLITFSARRGGIRRRQNRAVAFDETK